ncbi:hypothetical protein ACKQTC_05095 [Peptococcus simiae]|uniref:Uncharacterized protein n=1 Tax=Peptococcus simiae TaxID=1643805 RepID=A0ABW9GYU3_9FIRM
MPRLGSDARRLRQQARRIGLNCSTAIPQMKALLDDYAGLVWLAEEQNRPCQREAFTPEDTTQALLILDRLMDKNSPHARAGHRRRHQLFLTTMVGQAIDATARYPGPGPLYAAILKGYYCTYPRPTDMALMEDLHLERSSYYAKKKEAILCCALAFFGTISQELDL